ncbi:hypothetical protein ACQR3P_29175 [Rhodococcus sp. IEGM1300]
MQTTNSKQERIIQAQHDIDFPGETTLSTEWIGDVPHGDEDAVLYIHTTNVASYRYTLCEDTDKILGSELDWS